MVKKIVLILFVLYVAVNSVILYKYKQQKDVLNNENAELKRQLTKLKEKFIACETTCIEPICHADDEYQGDIRYIDCGESFINRWVTCLCTTMCLEDFTIVVTNRKRCRVWPSVPIQIRPEPSEEEDEEENDEE